MPYKRLNIAMLLTACAAISGCGPHPEGSTVQARVNAQMRAQEETLTPEQRQFRTYRACVGVANDSAVSEHCRKETGFGQ